MHNETQNYTGMGRAGVSILSRRSASGEELAEKEYTVVLLPAQKDYLLH